MARPALALALMAVLAGESGVAAGSLTVQTTYGPVEGKKSLLHKTHYWRGIPFGRPPVGPLRWRPPQAPEPWTSVRQATEEGNWCPQTPGADVDATGEAVGETKYHGNEDCLYLDVYAPSSATPESNLPVLFWIHGGGNRAGYALGDPTIPTATTKLYNGEKLAHNNNVVVVSTNYRLGVFGWLALDELREESDVNSTGNYGLMDQRFAMQWAQDNVKQFGGDPKKVLMFGESAGATDVCAQYVSKASAGLFRAALVESGLCGGKLPFLSLPVATNFGTLVAGRAGCVGNGTQLMKCLRGRSTGELMLPAKIEPSTLPPNPPGHPHLPWGLPSLPWWPVIDGTDVGVKEDPLDLIPKGNFNNVPLILGSNKDEGSLFIYAIAAAAKVKLPLDEAKAIVIFKYLFPGNPTVVSRVVKQYSGKKNWNTAIKDFARDYLIACPARRFMRETREYRLKHTPSLAGSQWMYLFDRKYDDVIRPILGDFHGSELFWVWDKPLIVGGGIWTPADYKLAKQMGSYWSSMAANGNPNARNGPCDGCIQWDAYNGTTSNGAGSVHIALDKSLHLDKNLYDSNCNMWDSIGYRT